MFSLDLVGNTKKCSITMLHRIIQNSRTKHDFVGANVLAYFYSLFVSGPFSMRLGAVYIDLSYEDDYVELIGVNNLHKSTCSEATETLLSTKTPPGSAYIP